MNLLHFHPKKHAPLIILGAAAILAILFDLLFFRHIPGISVPIFCATLLLILLWLDTTSHRRLNIRAGILAVLLLTFSTFFAFRANTLLLFLDACAILYLFTHLLATLYGTSPAGKGLLEYLLFPLTHILLPAILSIEIFSQLAQKSPKEATRIVLGLIIALPITLVFLSLFASADPLFASSISSLLGDLRIPTLVTHGILIGIITIGLTLLFAPAFWNTQEPSPTPTAETGLDFDLEALIVFGITNLVFLGFIVVQATSIFGGETHLTELGLTYAEYARQGFFQLLFATLLVVGLMTLARAVTFRRFQEAGRFLQGALVLQTFLILASSWARLSAYESAYGFTELRVWSHAALLAIGITLLFLLVSLFVRMRHSVVFEGMITIGLATLIGLNIFNPDLFIATQNIARTEKETSIPYDIPYLLSLSDDAAPAIGPFIEELVRTDSASLGGILEGNKIRFDYIPNSQVTNDVSSNDLHAYVTKGAYVVDWLNRKTPESWPSWNLARDRAEHIRNAIKSE